MNKLSFCGKTLVHPYFNTKLGFGLVPPLVLLVSHKDVLAIAAVIDIAIHA